MTFAPPAFHICLYARSPEARSPDERSAEPTWGWSTAPRSQTVTPAALQQPFPCSFEELAEQLQQFPRLYWEPDGSFVWVSGDLGPTQSCWQLDGMVYDRGGRLWYLELKGTCPRDAWDQLLAACGVSPDEVVVISPREGQVWSGRAFAASCLLP